MEKRSTEEIEAELYGLGYRPGNFSLTDRVDWYVEDCQRKGYPGQCVRREDYMPPKVG